MQITVSTRKQKEIVDITDQINRKLEKEKVENGLINLFVTHTTCALTTADLDPGTDLDMLEAFTEIIPKLKYRHPHDPTHVGDHIASSLIGSSLTIPVENGSMILGTWQRVVLVEFAGPRERKIIVNLI